VTNYGTMRGKCYRVFTRTWWKHNPAWPGGREPGAGRRYTHFLTSDEEEARAYCQKWNETHKPGRLSRKCEWESI